MGGVFPGKMLVHGLGPFEVSSEAADAVVRGSRFFEREFFHWALDRYGAGMMQVYLDRYRFSVEQRGFAVGLLQECLFDNPGSARATAVLYDTELAAQFS
ncbi:hypothetical protein CMI48_04020 [Candidatus Pacearchaeota archaeon]|nr:hypothetical protein [Candidatus Pacearchaeota archaeon]|tara:strand:+ start:90 stop:389 length:300 start_codon:yes stop_codon:yes gene_type:complete